MLLTRWAEIAAAAALMGYSAAAPNLAYASDGSFGANVKISIAGPNEMVIPIGDFHCSKPDSPIDGSLAPDLPDAPPRLWRRYDGQYELIAAHHNNIPWYSSDGEHFYRKTCASALPSQQNPDPSKYADQDWITGIYTKNGRDVYALVHDEYHGPAHIPACKARLAPGQNYWATVCLSVALTSAVSHDGGAIFEPLSGPLHIAAAPPTTVSSDNVAFLTQMGIRDPSNIIRDPYDGYFYFLAAAEPYGPQTEGTCLFRSKDPFTQPWLGWDGYGFNARMGSPYGESSGAALATCAPVFPKGSAVSALSYNTIVHKFIAVGKNTQRQLFAAVSPDLIDWNAEQPLRRSVQGNWWKIGDPDPDSYYSLIDPTSSSPFFDTTGQHPYIYYIHWNVGPRGVQAHQRDIMRVPLNISF